MQNWIATDSQATNNRPIVSRGVERYLAQLAVVFAAQFAAGKLGDVLQTLNKGGIGPVWPAAGIAVGAILIFGYSVWPGVAAGAFLLAFFSPLPHAAAVVYAGGTTLAALLAVFLLRRIADFDHSLSRLRDVVALVVLGAFGSGLLSASIGASTLYAAHIRGWSGFKPAWLIYWLGDSTGVLVVTPLVLTLPTLFRIRDRHRLTEFAVLLLLLTATSFATFGLLPLIPSRVHHLAFAVLPFVMWAAIRLGIGPTAVSILLLATIATVETALGSGPFTTSNPLMNAVLLDTFFAVVSVTGLTLAAAISEREQAERERERLVRERAEAEAQLRFAAIIESSEDAIVSVTLDGVIDSWNLGAQHIYGYTEAEALGKPVTMLVPPELPHEENKILETLRAGGRIEHFETVRVTKAGKRINVSLSVSPIKESNGQTVGWAGIVRDITERKRTEEALRGSEERLRLAHKAARIGGFERNIRTGVLTWTPEMEAVYGLPPGSFERTRAAFEKLLHPDDRDRVMSLVNSALKTGEPTEGEWRVIWPDGGVHWIAGRWQVLMDASGEPARVVGVNMDISERKHAEEALANMTRKFVEAQEQERARIGRELHDDINQRLAMLAVELEQLQNDPSEVQIRTRELRKQLSEISNDVQVLSHELHSSKLEYLGVVAGMKSWCNEFGKRQNMEIHFSSDVVHPIPLEIGVSLFRILQESLHNAAKHSGVKRVEVQLREESREIHLIVRDFGKGFDLETAMQGKGLGLTSMRERVRLVDGAIAIDSRPMGGTTIHVCVPLGSEQASQRVAG